MYLDKAQERDLHGERGEVRRWSMEVLVKLGEANGAGRMLPVTSVHLSNWRNGSAKAWEALRSIAGSATLPITANPDLDVQPDGLKRGVLESIRPHGCYSFSCAPYLSGNHPAQGDVIAWGGRAALSFANSVLGARGEKETFETAVASAITRLTPERGMLMEENRCPTAAIILPESTTDLRLLGWALAHQLEGEVPLLCGAMPSFDEAKRLAFAINSRGTVPLFRLQRSAKPPTGMERMGLSTDLPQMVSEKEPELIIMGCPHLSEQDINRWAKKMEGGRRTDIEAWFFTSRLCHDKCPVFGAVLRSRGNVFVDRCPLGWLDRIGNRSVATDSPSLAECLRSNGVAASYVPDEVMLSYLIR